jgi:disulfide bond formation protein DsbB
MSSEMATMQKTIPLPSLASAGLIIAGVSFLALAGAWGLQLFGGYAPCELCLQERIAYYIAVPAGILAALLAVRSPRISAILLAICGAALLYNAGLGVYHAGAEWKFWPGPATCTGVQQLSSTPEDLLKSLRHSHAIRCDEAALRIFGLSLAGYSALISLALSAIALVALGRYLRQGTRGPGLLPSRR